MGKYNDLMIKRLGTFFLDVFEVIVFAVGIFFFIYLLIMRPHKIDGQSMMPNFLNNEYLLTEKVTYYTRDPERGDVVVFTPPQAELDEYIKRVVGEPGENIMIKDCRVYINGRILNEPYIPDSVCTQGGSFLKEGQTYQIQEEEYFVMGDNRLNSSDSRYWGSITKSAMSGRAWVVYFPVRLAGKVPVPAYSFAE